MINRTLVAVKTRGENNFTIAKFVDCLVHHFEPNSISSPVQCKLEDNLLKLSPIVPLNKYELTTVTTNQSTIQWDKTTNRFISSDNEYVLLQHSPACPIDNLSEEDKNVIPLEVKTRGIDVAVSILVESKDCRILMTKRPEHMRTFPRAWVPPGGHIEDKESLVDAGLRELHEETGLTLAEDTSIQVLCLWESVYPVLLGLGSPVRHHVVVYLLAKVNYTSRQLLSKIKLDPEEVQACAWLSPEAVRFLLAGGSAGEGDVPTQEMLVLQPNGQMQEAPLNLSTMFHSSLWGNGQEYSGSQLALRCWINSLQTAKAAKL